MCPGLVLFFSTVKCKVLAVAMCDVYTKYMFDAFLMQRFTFRNIYACRLLYPLCRQSRPCTTHIVHIYYAVCENMCCSWDCCHHVSVVVVVLPLSRSGCDHAAAVILLSHSEPDRAAVMIVMSRVSGDLLQKIYCCFAAFSFSLLLRPTIVEFYGFF